MEKLSFSRVMAAAVASFALICAISCVNEEFEVSEENLDLNMQVFADGFLLPVGNTDTIMVKQLLDLVSDSQIDSLIGEIGGGYALSYRDTLDFSDTLNRMLDSLVIKAYEYNDPIAIDLNSVDLSDVKVDAMTFPEDKPYEVEIAELIQVPAIPPIDAFEPVHKTVSAGIYKYLPNMDLLKLPLDDITKDTKILELPEGTDIPGFMVNDNPIKIDPSLLSSFGVQFKEEFNESQEIALNLELPKGVTSVNEIILDENAALEVSVELVDPILSEGSIVPDVDIDLHNLLHLEGTQDDIAHLVNDFVLEPSSDPARNYKAKKTFGISSLAISKDDWMTDPATGKAVLKPEKRSVSVSASGSIKMVDCYTTTRLIQEQRHLEILLSLKFIDFRIADVEMSVEPVDVGHDEKMPVTLPDIEIPSEIKSIDKIVFGANPSDAGEQSLINLSLTPHNIDALTGLDITLEEFRISFPKGLVVKDLATGKVTSDSDNEISCNGESLKEVFSRTFQVMEFNLPAPKDVPGSDKKVISYSDEIQVTAKVVAGGDVKSSTLPTDEKNDIKFDVDASAAFYITDYQATINEFIYNVGDEIKDQKIPVPLPDEMKELQGSVTVYPKLIDGKSPAITLNIGLPNLPENTDISIVADNLRITFPDLLHFNTAEMDLTKYRFETSPEPVLVIDGEIPSLITLPIEKIVITPREENGKLVADGELKIEGSIKITESAVTKNDVETLTAPGSKVTFSASIPEMRPANVGINSYTMDLDQKIEVDFSSFSENIPEQLKSIGRIDLDDVQINFGLDLSSLMSEIEADLDLNVDISLPEMIKISDDRVTVDQTTGRSILSLPGELKDGKIFIDPIKVDALDLTGIDLAKALKDSIMVSGSATLANVNASTDVLGKTHNIDVNASIASAGEDVIQIGKVQAYIDYQVDPMTTPIDLSGLTEIFADEKLSADLHLDEFHIEVELATNLAASLNLNLEILPYFNGVADPHQKVPVELPVTTGESDVVRYWISNKNGAPSGYTYVPADILTLLRTLPDKIDVSFAGGVDPAVPAELDLSEDLKLGASYALELPFKLGEHFEVGYKDRYDELPSIVSQVFALGDLALQGKVTNSLPLQLEIIFDLLDSEGNVIELAEGSGRQIIPSCTADGKPSECDLDIKLVKKEGSDISDIASIQYEVKVTSGDAGGEQAFKPDSFITLSLRVLLPSGVAFDVSELGGLFSGEDEEDEQ